MIKEENFFRREYRVVDEKPAVEAIALYGLFQLLKASSA